jgi:hypothetical protein
MPRGGTHFAADYYNLCHENYDPKKDGIADYLMGAKVWHPHPRRQRKTPWEADFEFERKLTVIRNPWHVVASNMEMNADFQRAFLGSACVMVHPISNEQDIWLSIIHAHYTACLEWSGGDFERVEDLNPDWEARSRKDWRGLFEETCPQVALDLFNDYCRSLGYDPEAA